MMDDMHITHSMAPDDEELLRYVLDDGPLSEDQQAHIAQCSICQERIATYTQTNTFLLSTLYRSQCPSATELNFYCAQNILSPEDVFHIDAHIRQCPVCATEVADIKRVLKNFNPFPEVEIAPLATLRTLSAKLKQIIAVLVDQKPQLITRGELPATGWPRQYRAENINISLHLSRASNGDILLLGLFTSDDPDESVDALDGVVVDLYSTGSNHETHNGHAEQPLMSVNVDELGNFAFKAIAIGTYTMLIHLPESEVLIEGLRIEHG